jgi:hypothetical protein
VRIERVVEIEHPVGDVGEAGCINVRGHAPLSHGMMAWEP